MIDKDNQARPRHPPRPFLFRGAYSARNPSTGSTRMARSAGGTHATRAASSRNAAAVINAVASLAVTPNNTRASALSARRMTRSGSFRLRSARLGRHVSPAGDRDSSTDVRWTGSGVERVGSGSNDFACFASVVVSRPVETPSTPATGRAHLPGPSRSAAARSRAETSPG